MNRLPELEKLVTQYKIGYVADLTRPEQFARAVDSVVSDQAKIKRMKDNVFHGVPRPLLGERRGKAFRCLCAIARVIYQNNHPMSLT